MPRVNGPKIPAAQAVRPHRPSLDYLIENGLPVYLVNKSMPRSVAVITFSDSKGRGAKFDFPKTHLPVRLSDAIPTSMMRESRDLRGFITKGVLELLWPEDAERILTPEAEEDVREACAQASNPNSNGYKPGDDDRLNRGIARQGDAFTIEDANQAPPVHGRAMYVVNELNQASIDGRRAMRELQNIEGELKLHDFNYIVAEIEGQSDWANKIREWAGAKASALGGRRSDARRKRPGAIVANEESGTVVVE